MEPPEMHKMVGRPRVKRVREKNDARKRERIWSGGRKGLKMSCGHWGASDHNKRTCPLLQTRTPTLQDLSVSAPQSVFMPTFNFIASSSQQVTQPIDETAGPSNKKRKAKEKPAAHSKRTTKTGATTSSKVKKPIAPSRTLIDADENEDDDENEDEDEQPVVRPRTISEAKTKLQMKKLRQQPTGTKKISFRGDENGVSMPTNLPYSPRKLTWKGKSCVTSSQLTVEKEKKISKLKAKRGMH